MITKQFFVFGRVQGVGFRFFTLQQAGKLGLKGSVRNRIDGSVEVIAQGSENQIALMRAWLLDGPKTAKVERVIENNYFENKVFETFSIVSTVEK
ncbi:MAG: acylphosphatase [Haemophilus parahaemolyticus]|uniref:acylphosphatase n=1 Tax=Haemophilus parahaemolyticus TaxID=735 RepID=UPI0026F16155|nr:acylphosphatase [Haemophilus parahaemolyticus]MBS6008340.1 acylphosphatase [Haemophilus parahaemolyticus]